MNNNFDRNNLREFANKLPVPDLAAIAAKPAIAQHPWAGIPININLIPESCLFDLFLGESVDAANNAIAIANTLAAGQALSAPNGRPIPTAVANMILSMQLAIAQQKATLAHAAATMSLGDPGGERTRWRGPDGTLETGWAARYYADWIREHDAKDATTPEPGV